MKNELLKRTISSLIIIPFSIFFLYTGSAIFIVFLSFFSILVAQEWIKICKKSILKKIFGLIFLIFSLYSIYLFRNNLGFSNLFFVILVCIFTDIGGYSFGKIFKGPKLTKISPNKTISGLVGSYLSSLIGILIYIKILTNIGITNSNSFLYELSLSNLNYDSYTLAIILAISTVSQIGDLLISYFKRKAKIKDTGNIIPGHGGLLDRFDGMIFAIPFAYIIFSANIF